MLGYYGEVDEYGMLVVSLGFGDVAKMWDGDD
jgi:hypothetical protein